MKTIALSELGQKSMQGWHAPKEPDRTVPAREPGRGFVGLLALIDAQIPQELLADPEDARRARLITRFGVLGSIFGLIYAVFYLLIGHRWGASIILLCTAGVAVTPALMRWRKSIEPAGHFFSFVLVLGFFGLCFVEGGAHGHAIAWLANVPLCALLLLGTRAATMWAGISVAAIGLVVGLDLAGVKLAVTYDPKWESVVSAAGYLGLVAFMIILGLIFENGRARAHAQLEEALAKLAASNERLVYLNHEKNEFLGIAAHDLKNPLSVIMNSGDLLKITRDNKLILPMADQIVKAAERMNNLIKDLLDVNAIEEGRFASKIERCDLNALVQQVVEQNGQSANRKKIAIRVSVSGELIAQTDRAAVIQILDNLISNAVKYSPLEGTVHIDVGKENAYARVLVRDEGQGISEEDQKKLFQKYSRLSARPTGGESSTGLGLAIAKRLAETLSGTIECFSVQGAGTTFVLGLPLESRTQK